MITENGNYEKTEQKMTVRMTIPKLKREQIPFKEAATGPGTSAHDYISGARNLNALGQTPVYWGDPYKGQITFVFDDSSSFKIPKNTAPFVRCLNFKEMIEDFKI